MKTLILTFVITVFLMINNLFAQTKEVVINNDTLKCIAHDTVVQLVVEHEARFQNGDMARFVKYIMSNIRYPQDAIKYRYEGRVIIKFVVDWDGQIKDVIVLKSSGHKDLDLSAVLTISLSPLWSPAKNKNVCVPQQLVLPIQFKTFGIINQGSAFGPTF